MRGLTHSLLALLVVDVASATSPWNLADTRIAPEPDQVLVWYSGATATIGTNTVCGSNPPVTEDRVQAYAGYSLLPPNKPPGGAEVFYAHVVIGHPGNPCNGSAVGLEIMLPPGVVPVATAENPALCYARVPPNGLHGWLLINLANEAAYGCPQSFPAGLEGLRIGAPNGGAGGGSWGMAVGSGLEFMIPVRATTPQFGADSVRFRVNPDIGVVGYASNMLATDNSLIFRDGFELNELQIDLCTLSPIAQDC